MPGFSDDMFLEATRQRLLEGHVIPALPLALDAEGRFDEASQRRLIRYYLASGAGGLAAAVHTTQFAIRKPEFDLLRPLLEVVNDEASRADERPLLIAGAVGPTAQAVAEAELARSLGYEAVLLSPSGTAELDDEALIERSKAVGEVLPVIGFYMQDAVGGRYLDERYWRRLCELPELIGIKVACFDRYRSLDVVAAVAAAGAAERVALYTGNDDQILLDLYARYRFPGPDGEPVDLRFVGGLLGQWACWTSRAVAHLEQAHAWHRGGADASTQELGALLREASALTRANAAIFDVVNAFAGCIAGVNHVLHQQGLIASSRCLEAHERLSPGQAERIAAAIATWPELTDDDMVRRFLAAEEGR